MPLFCKGLKVVTDGELVALGQRLDYNSPVLTAMAVGGEDVTPDEAARLFDIELRLASLGDEVVGEIIDRALALLITAFPELFSAAA